MIPKRRLGKTNVDVTILGLGGEGVLRTYGHEREAYELINRAIDLGINYFDSAKAYAGCESYHGKALKERRKDIFLAGKSHARDWKGAHAHLRDTLKTMNTDHLDLWQMHDMRTQEDIDEVTLPRGALEAFVEAKEKGLVRFIGVTGHEDPSILRRCIELADFDTVLMPVNPAEPQYLNFIDDLIPFALQKNMGICIAGVYGAGYYGSGYLTNAEGASPLTVSPVSLAVGATTTYEVDLYAGGPSTAGCGTIPALPNAASGQSDTVTLTAGYTG